MEIGGRKEMQSYTAALTAYTSELRRMSDDRMVKRFCELRDMPEEAVREAGIFYVESQASMLLPDYIDRLKDFGLIAKANNKPIFDQRWVIPILDRYGMVLNLVGYKPDAADRYIYGDAAYYRRADTVWGMENFSIAYRLGWGIVTEGITDALRVRSLGYKNAFARCGTRKSLIVNRQMNRFRYGIIRIHDRDRAGDRTRSHWITNRYVTLNTPLMYKDTDETCYISDTASREERESNREWLKQYIDGCAEWLMQQEHRGLQSPKAEATMM